MNDRDEPLVVLDELSSGVWRATLNSPRDRNALSADMRREILGALSSARAGGAKVVIVRGDERAFSSGYRLDPGVMRPTTLVEDRIRLVEVTDFLRAYREQPVVTIAEIRGYCLAGGTDLLLASDIAVAATDASLGVPNVRGIGITLLLPVWSWVLGPHRAKLLALTGDTFSGAEAAEWGLVSAAFPGETLEAGVLALAERMAHMPGELLAITKHALNTAWDTAGFSNTLLRAAELDALSHGTRPVIDFWDTVVESGMRAALSARDESFQDSRILDLLH